MAYHFHHQPSQDHHHQLSRQTSKLAPILDSRPYGNLLDPLIHQLISLAIKRFVIPWHNQIANSAIHQHQKPFVLQLKHILTSLIIRLEHRLAALDWLSLILVDLPQLLADHLTLIAATHHRLARLSSPSKNTGSFDHLFLLLAPHPAIQLTTNTIPIQPSSPFHPQLPRLPPHPRFPHSTALVSPTYLRLLIEAVLQEVLDDEDWAPESERFIIREIILNLVLAPVLYQLTEPTALYALLVRLAPPPEPPPVRTPEPPEPGGWPPLAAQLRGALAGALHVLLLLPAFLGALIHLASTPPAAAAPRSDHRRFLPAIALLAALLPPSTQAAHLCWLLTLAVRCTHPLLTKIVVHVIYTRLLSPAALSDALLRINTLLADLDQTPDGPSCTPPDGPHLAAAAADALAARLPPALCALLAPGETPVEVAHGLLARSVAHQSANVTLVAALLDTLVVRIFPNLTRAAS